MIEESIIRDELDWKRHRFETKQDQLKAGEVVDEAMPSIHGRLGKKARGIGVCLLLLDEDDPEQWFRRAAEYLVEKIDKVDEYSEVIEDSYQWHRPTHSCEALNAAIIAGDDSLIDEAIQRTYAIDRQWILDTCPEFAHVLYYALALAAYLDGDPDAAHDWLANQPHEETDDNIFAGLYDALRAILASDEAALQTALEQVLAEHRAEYGPDTETAAGFVSVDAMVYLLLAREAGLTVDTAAFDEDLAMFLPPRLP